MADTSAPAAAPASEATPQKQTNSVSNATQEILNTLPAVEAAAEDAIDDIDDGDGTLSPEEAKKVAKKVEAAAKKAYKLKVGGRDVEVGEDELLKRAQMGYSADEKWQEASRMRKEMDSFIQLLQRDPAQALEQMGFNVDELAENRIKAKIEEMRKSPEQLEREKIERELKSLKEEREREREQARQQEMTRLQDQFAVEIENDISGALDSNTYGLPKSPYVVKRIADTMILAMQEGRRTNNTKLMNIKAADVLSMVQDEINSELNQMYNATPDEVFEKLVGKDRLNKYRKGKVTKQKATVKPNSVSDIKPTGQAEINKQNADKPKEKVKSKDFFSKLGSR